MVLRLLLHPSNLRIYYLDCFHTKLKSMNINYYVVKIRKMDPLLIKCHTYIQRFSKMCPLYCKDQI